MPSKDLEYLINHVFLPPKLPQSDDSSVDNAHNLCSKVLEAAVAYWQRGENRSVIRMLENLCSLYNTDAFTMEDLKQVMLGMGVGDFTTFLVRAQNTGVIIRKLHDRTVFEFFEVSPPNEVVMSNKGRLICSYPGPAIAVPSERANDPNFITEIAAFLAQMNTDTLEEALPTTKKAGSTVTETRDTAHPHYITEVLTGILRGMGHPEDVKRIAKRVADDVLWNNALLPWRRSPLWLVIRVALQTSLRCDGDDLHSDYKSFMAFLLTRILWKAVETGLASDLIAFMHKKVARRLYKIRDSAPGFVQSEILRVGTLAQALLKERWETVQARHASSSLQGWDPASLDPLRDTILSLQNSREYISNAMKGRHRQPTSPPFSPNEFPRLRALREYTVENFARALEKSGELALLDFEYAVEHGIDAWVKANLRWAEAASVTVALWIRQYAAEGKKRYEGKPEEKSVMFLTLLELWIGLDKLCVAQCGLLLDYPPEVSESQFTPLLLRRANSIARLKCALEYLRHRHSHGDGKPSIFSSAPSPSSFGVLYYNDSVDLQDLKARIEKEALIRQENKARELVVTNQRHRHLLQQARELEHAPRNGQSNKPHKMKKKGKKNCPKCKLEKEASSMKIQVFEWPLPSVEWQAKTVVFELASPVAFRVWRATTYHFLRNTCFPVALRKEVSSPKAEERLHTYSQLSSFFTPSSFSTQKITFASSTKSWLKTHYKGVSIPSTEEKVCLRNALQLRLFDAVDSVWISEPFSGCTIAKECTYALPFGPYVNLQYAIDSTSHTSNQVLANQSECSRELSLHEYIAFGSLRAGERLQWLNILRELRARILTFSQDVVEMLMTQAALQMGPLSDGRWDWHEELYDSFFQVALLNELRELKDSIRVNWSEVSSMRIVILLAHRVLSWSPTAAVTEIVHSLLQDAQHITYHWMKDVIVKLQKVQEKSSSFELQLRLCELAAACRATAGIDFPGQRASPPTAFPSSLSFEMFLHAGMVLRDNLPLNPETENIASKVHIFARDRRLSHCYEPLLAQTIASRGAPVHNNAIVQYWPSYTPRALWVQKTAPNDRWAYSLDGSLAFNMLENRLLVDGKPLGRLPLEVMSHPTYVRIFGQSMLDVASSEQSEPGTLFASKDLIHGHRVFFAVLPRSNELVITAKCSENNRRFELIPHTTMAGDLPHFFVDDYAHWLDLDEGVIELRPLSSVWISARTNWHLMALNTSPYLQKGFPLESVRLVDIRSGTASMISSRLRCLEHKEFITISYSTRTKALTVDIPRYRLSFSLNPEGQLACLTLANMLVDDDQSAGIMIGLQNQLVLRDKDIHAKRELLIPVGEISFSPHGHHTQVAIGIGSERRVVYYRYVVDDILGRLVGTTALHAKFYLIYLTALTSHCLPNPLTGRTGVEEALVDLQSGGARSFVRLDRDARDLLRRIGELAPQRTYYPQHLRGMQTVKWTSLPFMTQNDCFPQLCQEILHFADQLQVFNNSPSPSAEQKESPSSLTVGLLTERAAARHSCYDLHELTSSRGTKDTVYPSRDRECTNEASNERLVFFDSSLIMSWPVGLATTRTLLDEYKKWSTVSGPDTTFLAMSSATDCRYWLTTPFPQTWMTLYNLLRQNAGNRYRILFTLCLVGYGRRQANVNSLLPTLLAFAVHHASFSSIDPPSCNSYTLSDGFRPSKAQIKEVALRCSKAFRSDDFALEIPSYVADCTRLRLGEYQKLQGSEAECFADWVMDQWPCQSPQPPTEEAFSVLNITNCLGNLRPLFLSWYRNHHLLHHIQAVQVMLDCVPSIGPTPSSGNQYSFVPCRTVPNKLPASSSSLEHLLRSKGDPDFVFADLPSLMPSSLARPSQPPSRLVENDSAALYSLVNRLQESGDSISNRYADDMRASLDALREESMDDNGASYFPCEDVAAFHGYNRECERHLDRLLEDIRNCLCISRQSAPEAAMLQAGIWPRLGLRTLLESTASTRSLRISEQWRESLRHLGRSLLLFQRSRRLLLLAYSGKHDDLLRELNVHRSVLQIENSDWLLIQEMITPSAGQNTLVQLNMGEGKSSVIVPMVAAALSDGSKLARVVVLKSLARQMFSLLLKRLSGLTNRQILYLPFSRSLRVGDDEARRIRDLLEHALKTHAVLVAQPEHILSFKLLSINRFIEGASVSRPLIQIQLWLDRYARDLLDESDEILHTRYQLIYTIGTQKSVEHAPDRWILAQQVLSLVKECALSLHKLFPLGIEVGKRAGNNFPSIRVLQKDAEARLISDVVDGVMEGKVPHFYLRGSRRIREVARSFIVNEWICAGDLEFLESHCSGTSLWKHLLVLRGLFGYGILAYTLRERRWRVDFGLDLSRSLLAVPYLAKDVPSPRAEFGHPEVAILLTCFSYLYGGLSQSELDTCFQLLFKTDNPGIEYSRWVSAEDIPVGLRNVAAVNVKDTQQTQNELYPIFRYNHACIEFYLSNVVFPKAMKEFPYKLATTGWDLACRKSQVTTGFSGTNENRYLLPTSITQENTSDRLGTNAGMLAVLSQPENDRYICPSTRALSGREIINAIVDECDGLDVRVLLDVGAQILEMTNVQVVDCWLSKRPDIEAAVYFDENDELTVMSQDRTTELLALSPYHHHLDDCLVYLDDAHTRGTDLKLPVNWKACVTLGPKVTKDRLAQGCMRMRKLGHGQTVMFMAPPEIDMAIRQRANKHHSAPINSLDVLLWAMLETCSELERHVPLWIQQGVDFDSRAKGWKAVSAAKDALHAVEDVKSTWLQPEGRTLQDMYGSGVNSNYNEVAQGVDGIRERCEMLGVSSILDPRLGEEQEREQEKEVNHEIERETQIERPSKTKAAKHSLSDAVKNLVQSGNMNPHIWAEFVSAFVPVRDAVLNIPPPPSPVTATDQDLAGKTNKQRRRIQESAVQYQSMRSAWEQRYPQWNRDTRLKLHSPYRWEYLLATQDFLTTIESSANNSPDDYLRPITWVLSISTSSSLVVLSPFEVNELLPKIRRSENVRLHLYAPRTVESMAPVDDFRFYCIPSEPPRSSLLLPSLHAIDQLNLCAGQLYFADYETYQRVSSFLGLATPRDHLDGVQTDGDGFVQVENRLGRPLTDCKFVKSPVPYLKTLMNLRRRGMTFEGTHVGKLLHGRPLRENDFD
ncbi:hypothetical protein V5O48_012255 [Marasmius crinis-equi]|uniref:ubiquitinyl hydrolase 1 n=1 Tax=Marasmius crinis-equi TaxID=585013 RepID=A0ABR3F394_9AGAR